jgi:hypothetical protein
MIADKEQDEFAGIILRISSQANFTPLFQARIEGFPPLVIFLQSFKENHCMV